MIATEIQKSRDEPHRRSEEAAEVDRLTLRDRILRFLRARGIDRLEDLRLEVDGGTVYLSGPVASPHDRWLCVNCVRHVAGVRRVVDQFVGTDGVRAPRPR